jgi:heme/copper-type cytochrome/quinol oxidase subunit 3
MEASGAPRPARSMSAQVAVRASAVARRRRSQPNGIWGMALFLASEITIFGTLLSSYFYLDFEAHRWPPAGIKFPETLYPSVAAGWLFVATVPMWLASRAARSGNRTLTLWSLAAGFLAQAGYLTAQVILFRHDLLEFSPKGSAYGSIYFTILATHNAHVVLGLALDLAVIWFILMRGLTNYWLIGVRGLAMFWYVVAFLEVPVLLTTLSPSFH